MSSAIQAGSVRGLVLKASTAYEKGYYYDVNSLFPYAMKNDMPVGRPIGITGEYMFLKLVRGWDNFFGVAQVQVKSPTKFTYLPFLCMTPEGGGNLIKPQGE